MHPRPGEMLGRQVRSNQVESVRVRSSQVESGRVRSSQVESCRVMSSRGESRRVNARGIGTQASARRGQGGDRRAASAGNRQFARASYGGDGDCGRGGLHGRGALACSANAARTSQRSWHASNPSSRINVGAAATSKTPAAAVLARRTSALAFCLCARCHEKVRLIDDRPAPAGAPAAGEACRASGCGRPGPCGGEAPLLAVAPSLPAAAAFGCIGPCRRKERLRRIEMPLDGGLLAAVEAAAASPAGGGGSSEGTALPVAGALFGGPFFDGRRPKLSTLLIEADMTTCLLLLSAARSSVGGNKPMAHTPHTTPTYIRYASNRTVAIGSVHVITHEKPFQSNVTEIEESRTQWDGALPSAAWRRSLRIGTE